MSTRQYFGTDGIRGRVGTPPITPDFVLKLGWAVGSILANGGGNKVIIGKDTRISGYMFESALEAGLSAAGVNVDLLGPMPTPAVAYLTRTLRAKAGIVISASHNPYYDNGIKFFSANGSKLADEIELAIEAQLALPLTCVSTEKLGRAVRIDDAAGRYIEFCKNTVPPELSLKGLKIVVDCAHGAAYHIAPDVFQELGANVIKIGASPNGFNINESCGATHPALLAETVKQTQADLGIALDGDGDRVIMVDNQGEIIDGDELLFIIAKHLYQKKQLQGGVVGTLMSNFGLERALTELHIPFIRSQVGDRYVLAALQEQNWQIGGESSGHIIHLGLSTTGDGIVSALQVVRAIIESNKSLHELKQGMHKLPQKLINVRVNNLRSLAEYTAIQDAVKQVEKRLKNAGRVLLRPSGTEPLVRVMVEGENEDLVNELAKHLAAIVETEMQ